MKLPLALFLAVLGSSGTALAGAPKQEAPTLPSTMKAVRVHAYGGLDALRYEDVPRPSPGPGEILIRVHAAGVNPVDQAVREGWMKDRLKHTPPLTLGWDLSGVVAQVGPKVTRFKRGEEVHAHLELTRGGAYAEYAIAKEAEVAPKPKTLDHLQAAAVPLTALTAWQALVDTAKLDKGQTVLIHGGSGGVGTMAIQLAKSRGARVIATASAQNLDYLKSLGADEVIDYRSTRFEEVVKDVDVVLDTVSGDTEKRSWQVLKKGGILVSLLNPKVVELASAHGVRGGYILVKPDARALAELDKLISSGKIKPVVSEVIPLAEVRRAHEQIQSRHTRGKLVLRVVE